MLRMFFRKLHKDFLQYPDAEAVCGGTSVFVKKAGREEIILHTHPITNEDLLFRSTIGIPSINSFFFRQAVFSKIGFFDLGYRLASDRDFLIRISYAGLTIVSIAEEVYRYRSHPDSLTIYDVWKPLILDENLRLAAFYTNQNDNIPIRKACMKWEKFYTLEIIGHFLRKKDIHLAKKYFFRASRRYWWWPVYFLGVFPFRIVTYLLHKKSAMLAWPSVE